MTSKSIIETFEKILAREGVNGKKSFLSSILKKHPNAVCVMPKPVTVTTPQFFFEDDYWTYAPNLISPNYFKKLLQKLQPPPSQEVYEKSFKYKSIAQSWDETPAEILEIKKRIESTFGYTFDYVCTRAYSDYKGYAKIRRNTNAENTETVVVSLGMPRRFEVKKPSDKDVFDVFTLQGGDVFHMHGLRENRKSCQETFVHALPKVSAKELKNYILSLGYKVEGRSSFKNLEKIILSNDICTARIDLTFCQIGEETDDE